MLCFGRNLALPNAVQRPVPLYKYLTKRRYPAPIRMVYALLCGCELWTVLDLGGQSAAQIRSWFNRSRGHYRCPAVAGPRFERDSAVKLRPIILAGVAALLPVLSASSVSTAAAAAAQPHFVPPSDQLVLTRTVTRNLSGGKQIVVTRRYVIQFVADGTGYVLNGSQLDVTVEVPPMLSGLAEIERKRTENGLFPAWVDASGVIMQRPAAVRADGSATNDMSSAAQGLLLRSGLTADRKQEGALYLGQLTAQPGGSPWPADLFRAAPGERRQHRVVALADGAQGEVNVVVRVAALMPCGLPSAVEREITTVLEGSSQVSRELWTLELVSSAKL